MGCVGISCRDPACEPRFKIPVLPTSHRYYVGGIAATGLASTLLASGQSWRTLFLAPGFVLIALASAV